MGMPEAQRIDGDITRELAQTLHAGDQVLYSGIIYTARDAAAPNASSRRSTLARSRPSALTVPSSITPVLHPPSLATP